MARKPRTPIPYPRFHAALKRYAGELPRLKRYRWARGNFGETSQLAWLVQRPDVLLALYEDITNSAEHEDT
jgi:hypothetical protein